jgi:hypothetical protein
MKNAEHSVSFTYFFTPIFFPLTFPQQVYVDICRQLQFELGEIYADIADERTQLVTSSFHASSSLSSPSSSSSSSSLPSSASEALSAPPPMSLADQQKAIKKINVDLASSLGHFRHFCRLIEVKPSAGKAGGSDSGNGSKTDVKESSSTSKEGIKDGKEAGSGGRIASNADAELVHAYLTARMHAGRLLGRFVLPAETPAALDCLAQSLAEYQV